MKYGYLGRSALKVSPLCIGAMMFAGETDEATSQRILDKAFDQGMNFVDTTNVYHAGLSEDVAGKHGIRSLAILEYVDGVCVGFDSPVFNGASDHGPVTEGAVRVSPVHYSEAIHTISRLFMNLSDGNLRHQLASRCPRAALKLRDRKSNRTPGV